jgi:hypothetical protein
MGDEMTDSLFDTGDFHMTTLTEWIVGTAFAVAIVAAHLAFWGQV